MRMLQELRELELYAVKMMTLLRIVGVVLGYVQKQS